MIIFIVITISFLGSLVVASNITKCHCKKFELTSHGRALAWQKSKLGKYDHVPFSVASKDLFYNFYQKQYLFWAEDKPGYWMVSKRIIYHVLPSIGYIKNYLTLNGITEILTHIYSLDLIPPRIQEES